ncbi:cytochrome o ubiquinol oxidase subunit III [Candidatus Pseudomonas adelgestsugas]|uniref:Cytochrome bo(3) ubiquinol oxidase subunit 3 n=1 Tax=Candidatus Pseudomonas adelgestsugas TaxID=1302376 RepID=A0ABX5RB84_9PSED|nr:cytochrome o ubiquinol oxidase subunit III [Candidatus Pseudomonas adelgestsugas]QAX82275.1 Cytochrome bo(3) ubiquinol oxidase subunit 3 [Candidatus Pseudomonas adelgestsugas]
MSSLVTKFSNTYAGSHHRDHGSTTIFGFWLYLMTDCILFASIFAVYAVLVNNIADGPSGRDIFELPYVLGETAMLLFSSIIYGLAMLAFDRGNKKSVLGWLALTFLLGLGFITMEIKEFYLLISEGYGPHCSGFLSAFFTLLGTHGLHITAGLLWMAVMIYQVNKHGLTNTNNTRLSCLSLFWHFLDVIWICIFTIVYLMGAM